MSQILVVGATGYLGGLITRRLLELREVARIAVRPSFDYSQLTGLGATPTNADLKDAASLRLACKGVDVVITTANSAQRGGTDTVASVDVQGNRNLIEAACEAGVRQFIFVSAFGATSSHPVPFLRAKAETEETLRASGLNYTILSPHIFMDVWIPMIVGSAVRECRPVLLIGEGERKHAFVAAADVAAFAVAAALNEGARNRTIPIGGPHACSWLDIIAAVEAQLGRSIGLNTVPVGQPVPQLPELISGLLTGMEMADVRIPMEETAREFGLQQTTVEQFISNSFRG